MKVIETIRTIERIDALIRRKSTGPPKALAQKLGVSERTVYSLIDLMKQLDAPITYNHCIQSYKYDYEVKFGCRFYSVALPGDKVFGGNKMLKIDRFIHCEILAETNFYLECNLR